jgi:glycosyltransferase involved in cell wall biosynthesis
VRGLFRQPDLAIVHRFRPAPYGGSNQFLTALRTELRARGLHVSDGAVGRKTRACLLHSYLVDAEDIRARLHEGLRVVHRVDGPIALYRGSDDGSDQKIVEINQELAHATIFQSHWSLEAHRVAGLVLRDPVVIPNAVDPSIFFPEPARPLGPRIRLIATSWSDNPNKGGETLRWLARALDPRRYDLTFVGRAQIDLGSARVVPPLDSKGVASLLREHDVYLAPSRNDPCSNALLEALACGLPVLYLSSGGHPELVGDAGLGYEDRQEIPGLLEQLASEYDERRGRISISPLTDVADRYLVVLGLR